MKIIKINYSNCEDSGTIYIKVNCTHNTIHKIKNLLSKFIEENPFKTSAFFYIEYLKQLNIPSEELIPDAEIK